MRDVAAAGFPAVRPESSRPAHSSISLHLAVDLSAPAPARRWPGRGAVSIPSCQFEEEEKRWKPK